MDTKQIDALISGAITEDTESARWTGTQLAYRILDETTLEGALEERVRTRIGQSGEFNVNRYRGRPDPVRRQRAQKAHRTHRRSYTRGARKLARSAKGKRLAQYRSRTAKGRSRSTMPRRPQKQHGPPRRNKRQRPPYRPPTTRRRR